MGLVVLMVFWWFWVTVMVVVVEVDVGSLLLLFHDKKVWGESMTREQR